MPFLEKDRLRAWDPEPGAFVPPIPMQDHSSGPKRGHSALFPLCSNAACKAGRFRLWRSRQTPVLEGGWLCSPECTRARLRRLLAREMEGRNEVPIVHRHRVPLGLVMLAQGWISQAQLRTALEAQKRTGQGRLGDRLIADHGIAEQIVTRALGVQWSCPVFSLDGHQPEMVAPLVPRLFVDSFGVVPVRATLSRALHLGFEDRLDPCLSFAIERMTGLRVEAGLLNGSDFRRSHMQMLTAVFPRTRLIEASGLEALVRALGAVFEDSKAVEARLVRVHDFFWLRLWRSSPAEGVPQREQVEDVICSLMQMD